MSESQQPQLIISVSGGYLVFIGLIVAASATVLASDRASEMPVWARAILLIPLAISVMSGVAALIGANAAHNIGRRSEKLAAAAPNDPERPKLEAKVASARALASDSIYWSLTGAIASAVMLFVTMLPVVFVSNPDAKARAAASASTNTAAAAEPGVQFTSPVRTPSPRAGPRRPG